MKKFSRQKVELFRTYVMMTNPVEILEPALVDILSTMVIDKTLVDMNVWAQYISIMFNDCETLEEDDLHAMVIALNTLWRIYNGSYPIPFKEEGAALVQKLSLENPELIWRVLRFIGTPPSFFMSCVVNPLMDMQQDWIWPQVMQLLDHYPGAMLADGIAYAVHVARIMFDKGYMDYAHLDNLVKQWMRTAIQESGWHPLCQLGMHSVLYSVLALPAKLQHDLFAALWFGTDPFCQADFFSKYDFYYLASFEQIPPDVILLTAVQMTVAAKEPDFTPNYYHLERAAEVLAETLPQKATWNPMGKILAEVWLNKFGYADVPPYITSLNQ